MVHTRDMQMVHSRDMVQAARYGSYQDMIRSEAPVQNSLSVYVGQGLQDGLPMLDQGSK